MRPNIINIYDNLHNFKTTYRYIMAYFNLIRAGMSIHGKVFILFK